MIDPRNQRSLLALRNALNALMVGAIAVLAAGCGGDDDNDSSPAVRRAAIQFQGQVNGQDFVCGATYENVGIGQPGTYQVTDWRFYVHDVELVKADGARRTLDLDQDGVWQ
ncbi:MAG: hypothetical protein KDJ31_17890, partial [Candidatus Competibacteraceae bacterium]|nr:hypothetical protein [Candidatus Competibacteraceae bacterium]